MAAKSRDRSVTPPLTADDRGLLLALARQSLEAAVRRQPDPPLPPVPPALEASAGVFVSLHGRTELRGCVGYVEARLPLCRAVMEAAAAAALRDHRFPPVKPWELPDLIVEISVLSPRCSARLEDIQIGVHGVMVTQEQARGLLLPKVAVERQWEASRFLEETCRKAGLAPDAWRRGAAIEVFTAEVFREEAPATA